jgi:hypothetical protein
MSKGSKRDASFDDGPKRRSVRREPSISHRDLGDDFTLRKLALVERYVKPLLRFLRRQVGQPWSQVQPELDARCRALKVDAGIRKLVRDRLMRHVDTDVVQSDGVGWVDRSTGQRSGLFVHPENGALCHQGRQPKGPPRARRRT